MVDTGETDVSRTENTWKPGGSGRTVFLSALRNALPARNAFYWEATQKHALADVADSVPLQLWTRPNPVSFPFITVFRLFRTLYFQWHECHALWRCNIELTVLPTRYPWSNRNKFSRGDRKSKYTMLVWHIY